MFGFFRNVRFLDFLCSLIGLIFQMCPNSQIFGIVWILAIWCSFMDFRTCRFRFGFVGVYRFWGLYLFSIGFDFLLCLVVFRCTEPKHQIIFVSATDFAIVCSLVARMRLVFFGSVRGLSLRRRVAGAARLLAYSFLLGWFLLACFEQSSCLFYVGGQPRSLKNQAQKKGHSFLSGWLCFYYLLE